MIITSTTQQISYTPKWRKGQADAPTYFLRAGSTIERGQMEAELGGEYDAGRVYSFELRVAARAGVAALLADDPEMERILELIDQEEAVEMQEDGAENLLPEDQALLREVRKVLARHWPEYRDLTAQANRRSELSPIVALKRFCVGWENACDDNGATVPFVRGRDGLVTESALGALPALEMRVVGNHAYALQYGAAGQEKNFEQPSSSGEGPTSSDAVAISKEAGTSEASDGEKTLA